MDRIFRLSAGYSDFNILTIRDRSSEEAMNQAKIIFDHQKKSRSWMMWLQVIAILALYLAGCVKTPEELREEARPYLDRGIKYLQMKDPTGALKELLKAVEITPNDPQIHNWLGLAYQLKHEYKESEDHLKKSIELDPKFSEARNNLGATYLAMEEWDKAIEQFKIISRDVLYRSPDLAYNNLGYAYFRKGMFDEAIENYQKSLKLNDAMPVAHHNLGLVLLELGKMEEAIKEFHRAIEIYPEYVDAHYWLARTYVRLKFNDRAIKEFKEVIRLAPSSELEKSARQYISILESKKPGKSGPSPALSAPGLSEEGKP